MTVIVDWEGIAAENHRLAVETLRASLYADHHRPGDCEAAYRKMIRRQLIALGIDIERLTDAEVDLLNWMAGWDQPTVGAFLTLARRLAQDGHAPASRRAAS